MTSWCWSEEDVGRRRIEDERAKARQACIDSMGDLPPCPNCGGPSSCDLIEVSTWIEIRFMPGLLRCDSQCYLNDPDGYLAAVCESRYRSV